LCDIHTALCQTALGADFKHSERYLQRNGILLSLLLCVMCVFCWQVGSSRAGDSHSQTTLIAFNDPAHAEYFRYQAYLVAHGEKGDVAPAWNSLPAEVRAEKVSEKELFLKNLKHELLSKPALTVQEKALFYAVWGKTQEVHATQTAITSEDKTKEQLQASASKTFETKTTARVEQDLPKYQKNGNWKKFFDGATASGGDVVDLQGTAVRASNYRKADNAIVDVRPVQKSLTVVPLPESKQEPIPSQSKTGAIAGGAMLVLGAFAFGAKKVIANRKAKTSIDSEFDLDLRIMDKNHGLQSGNDKATYGCTRSCVGDSCATCDDTCANSCGCQTRTHCSNCCDAETHVQGCGATVGGHTCGADCIK